MLLSLRPARSIKEFSTDYHMEKTPNSVIDQELSCQSWNSKWPPCCYVLLRISNNHEGVSYIGISVIIMRNWRFNSVSSTHLFSAMVHKSSQHFQKMQIFPCALVWVFHTAHQVIKPKPVSDDDSLGFIRSWLLWMFCSASTMKIYWAQRKINKKSSTFDSLFLFQSVYEGLWNIWLFYRQEDITCKISKYTGVGCYIIHSVRSNMNILSLSGF